MTFNKIGLHLDMPFTTLDNDTFQALFNYASIGILITNASGEIQLSNKYIEHQFGYNDGELTGKKIEVLIPSGVVGLRKDGSEFPVEVRLKQYKRGQDNYSLTFINDITHDKETEHPTLQLSPHRDEKAGAESQTLTITVAQLDNHVTETERKDADLERVNTFLNNIWNHAGAIIFVCDIDGIIQFFNPAAEKWLGYTATEVTNKMSLTNFHISGELRKKAEELSVLTGRKVNAGFEVFTVVASLNENNNQEWHYVRKDRSTFFVSFNITPLKDAQNNISSYLGIAIDISEKKKAETELLAALEKEKELNELKSRFVSMASHEFRTPLSAVLSSAYLVSKYVKTEEQPQREKHIQRIVFSVISLTEILNDFLSVGKIEEGNIQPHYHDFNVKDLVQDIIHEVNHLLKEGQAISYEHKGSTSAYLDPSMLKHIVTNLLSNAIKFSNEQSIIELLTEKHDNKLSVSVKDSGIGIPEEDIPNLFRRFFRSSNATNIQGTGLGLHIVSKYADLMNGKIECKSKIGDGTTFTITFNNDI